MITVTEQRTAESKNIVAREKEREEKFYSACGSPLLSISSRCCYYTVQPGSCVFQLRFIYSFQRIHSVCVWVCVPVGVYMQIYLCEDPCTHRECVSICVTACVCVYGGSKSMHAVLSVCSRVPLQAYSTVQAPVCVSRCKYMHPQGVNER